MEFGGGARRPERLRALQLPDHAACGGGASWLTPAVLLEGLARAERRGSEVLPLDGLKQQEGRICVAPVTSDASAGQILLQLKSPSLYLDANRDGRILKDAGEESRAQGRDYRQKL